MLASNTIPVFKNIFVDCIDRWAFWIAWKISKIITFLLLCKSFEFIFDPNRNYIYYENICLPIQKNSIPRNANKIFSLGYIFYVSSSWQTFWNMFTFLIKFYFIGLGNIQIKLTICRFYLSTKDIDLIYTKNIFSNCNINWSTYVKITYTFV